MSIEQEAKQLKEVQDKRCHDRIVINPTRACEICGKLAITEKFYAFPCRHTFHIRCLKSKWDNPTTDSCYLCGLHLVDRITKDTEKSDKWAI